MSQDSKTTELGNFNEGVKSSIHDSINQKPINVSNFSPSLSRSSKSNTNVELDKIQEKPLS